MSIIIWALLLVFFAPAEGFQKSYRLNTFDTQEACQVERNRVGFDMAEAYPHERDFEIVCKPLSKTIEENIPKTRTQEKLAVSDTPTQGQLPAPMRALLSHWLEKMYPSNDDVRLLVLKAQRVYGTEHGTVMFAVRIQEQDQIKQDFLIFISQNKIIGWTTAQFPRESESPSYEEAKEKQA